MSNDGYSNKQPCFLSLIETAKDDVEAGSIDGAVTLPLGIEEPRDPAEQPPKCFPERCYGALPLFICCDEQTQLKNSRVRSRQLLERRYYQIVVLVVIIVAIVALVCGYSSIDQENNSLLLLISIQSSSRTTKNSLIWDQF